MGGQTPVHGMYRRQMEVVAGGQIPSVAGKDWTEDITEALKELPPDVFTDPVLLKLLSDIAWLFFIHVATCIYICFVFFLMDTSWKNFHQDKG